MREKTLADRITIELLEHEIYDKWRKKSKTTEKLANDEQKQKEDPIQRTNVPKKHEDAQNRNRFSKALR